MVVENSDTLLRSVRLSRKRYKNPCTVIVSRPQDWRKLSFGVEELRGVTVDVVVELLPEGVAEGMDEA